jgi:hypothetical protein
MDFMKLLKSLEELLYEVMVMLVFYPRTLWLTIRHPQRMMDYADTELGDVQSEQYTDTLSPPLFLMICLAISHGISVSVNPQGTTALPGILAQTENLLAFRLFLFSLFSLMMALRLLKMLGIALDRESLRAPFYSQCFVTAPVAMALGVATSMPHLLESGGREVAWGMVTVVLGWYLYHQTKWFRGKLDVSWPRAAWIASSTAMIATLISIAILVGTALILGRTDVAT